MQNKIFDICGTLYNSNTTMDFCEYRCNNRFKKTLLKLSKTLPSKALNKILLILFDLDMIRVLHVSSLKNRTKKELEKDAELFVDNYLEDRKITEVHNKLKEFSKDEIILVSATVEPVAKAISQKLGNVKYMATTLKYQDDICLGIIKDDLLGNKQNYFKDSNVDFIITDNKSDLPLCKTAKDVIIVSKEKNLKFWENQDLNILKIIKV